MSKELLGSLEINRIYQMDCLEGMRLIPDKSINMILCDLPYQVSDCKWDSIIPFGQLWEQYERIIKDNGAIVLTATQPFTTKLISSNYKLYKYNWVWEKDKPTNFGNANRQPMKYHEDVCVFYKKQPTYNKQMIPRNPNGALRCKTPIDHSNRKRQGQEKSYGNIDNKTIYDSNLKNPSTIIYFDTGRRQDLIHNTQKPVALFEYFIKTYTNEDELVLDNCMGSFTTAIACMNTDRKFIGFEIEQEYIDLGNKRLEDHKIKIQ